MVPDATNQPHNDEYDQNEAKNPTESTTAISIVAIVSTSST